MPEFITQFESGARHRGSIAIRTTARTPNEAISEARSILVSQGRDHDAQLIACDVYDDGIRKGAKLKATKQIEELLVDALECAELQRCSVNADAQDEMYLYLQSWVAGPLRDALDLMRGEKQPHQVHRSFM
jgi:hypothetical protein